jgi:2,3-bisphosphoglycerate-dependent phosphoglycerate mutase
MTRLILVRHAQSAPSRDMPERDWPLSQLGRQQAAELPPILANLGVDALASSPYLRAVETLRPYADASQLPILIDDDLRERALGGWIDDPAEVDAAVKRMHADLHFHLDGGETGHACLERFEAALTRLAAAHPRATLAVGSHGGVIGHLLARLEPSLPDEFWRRIRNPHLFVLELEPGLVWTGERTLDGSAGIGLAARQGAAAGLTRTKI